MKKSLNSLTPLLRPNEERNEQIAQGYIVNLPLPMEGLGGRWCQLKRPKNITTTFCSWKYCNIFELCLLSKFHFELPSPSRFAKNFTKRDYITYKVRQAHKRVGEREGNNDISMYKVLYSSSLPFLYYRFVKSLPECVWHEKKLMFRVISRLELLLLHPLFAQWLYCWNRTAGSYKSIKIAGSRWNR